MSTTFSLAGAIALLLAIILLIVAFDLKLYSFILLGVAAVLLLASAAISFQTMKEAVTSRRGKYSTNTAVMVTAFVGLVAVANFLAIENFHRMDVTATSQFSMAPQTKEILKNLDRPIKATAFFLPGRSEQEDIFLEVLRGQVDDFLREFEARSGKFSSEFVDPVVERLVAEELNATTYPTIVFVSTDPADDTQKKRHEVNLSSVLSTGRLPSLEQDFVTAMLIVTGQEQKKVFFLAGHEERDIFNPQRGTDGFGVAYEAIGSENYVVNTVSLFQESEEVKLFPEPDPEGKRTVNMLVVAAPLRDLLQGEAELMDRYLMEGGRILFLVDSGFPPSFLEFLERWGVTVGNGHIVDERSLRDNPEIVSLTRGASYLPIPGLERITGLLSSTYHPGVTSLMPTDGVDFTPDLTANGEAPAEENPEEEPETPSFIRGGALAITSDNSWLIEEIGRNDPRPDEDIQGPFFPAVAIIAFKPLFLFSVGLEFEADLENGLISEALVGVFEENDLPLTTLDKVATDEEGVRWLITHDSTPTNSTRYAVQKRGEKLTVDPTPDEDFIPTSAPASIVVFGDSDFASNNYFEAVNNGDFFLNSINWLVGDIPLASIRPKQFVLRQLNLTPNEFNFMRYSGWLLLPVLMAVLGGFVWWRRR